MIDFIFKINNEIEKGEMRNLPYNQGNDESRNYTFKFVILASYYSFNV